MLSLGASGELLVARLRALLSLLILAMPLIAALGGAKSGEVVVGLGLAVFTNLMAQIWLVLARRQLRYSWLSYATTTNYVTPTTLMLAEQPGKAEPETLKTMPVFFDASNDVIEQHFATSKAATRVQYFIVPRKDTAPAGRAPTPPYGE